MRHLTTMLLCLLPALALGQSAVTVRGPAGADGSDGADAPTTHIATGHLSATTTASTGTGKIGTGTAQSGTWAEDADTAAAFDAGTGTWTAPADGLYYVALHTRSSTGLTQALIYVEGVQTLQGPYLGSGSSAAGALSLSSGDTVEFYVYHNSSATIFEDHASTGYDTFYSIVGPL